MQFGVVPFAASVNVGPLNDDAPWMDTQDLQFFWEGNPASIRPIRVEALFDGRPESPTLSDHDGFMVTYEIAWPASVPVGPVC